LFKGLGNLANLGTILKQAQQMGTALQAVSEQLKQKHVVGSAGGGLIEVEANGLGEVLAVRIDPSLLEKGDREMIEDLLPAAFNQAATRAKQLHAEAMKSAAQSIKLPPGLEEAFEQLAGGGGPDKA